MVSRRVRGVDHEARTHLCETMASLGWKCVGRTPIGVPNEFEKGLEGFEYAFYIRTALRGKWRLEQYSGYTFQVRGYTVAKMNKINSPHFDTPLGLALWVSLCRSVLGDFQDA